MISCSEGFVRVQLVDCQNKNIYKKVPFAIDVYMLFLKLLIQTHSLCILLATDRSFNKQRDYAFE